MNIFNKENIILLSYFALFFGIIVLVYGDEVPEDVYAIIYTTPLVVIVIMSLSLSRRYKKIAYFSYGHVLLGLSYLAHLLAEITWRLMDYLQLPQYPSYPDIFYAASAIFLICHPWIIMRHFKVKPKRTAWLLFALCIVGGNLLYVTLSIDSLDSDSFWLGFGFVTLATTMLGSTAVAIVTLHGTKIFRVWILLGVAFFVNALADIYYYSSENSADWEQGDIVNVVWFTAYILIIYALTEHRYKYSRNPAAQ